MREEVWVHPSSGIQFAGRDEYLIFLRERKKMRLSARRLLKARAEAEQRLRAVRDVVSFEELGQFLTDHSRDIAMAARSTDQTIVLTQPFKFEVYEEYSAMWRCGVRYGFTSTETPNHRRPYLKENVETRDIHAVLEGIGMEYETSSYYRSGTCGARHVVWMLKDDFPGIAVFETLKR